MIIKVCGMWNAENIKKTAALDVDLLGFVFDRQSPYFVQSELSYAGIIPDRANRDVRSGMEQSAVQTVGVFADEMPQTVIAATYNYHLDFIQLEGGESRVYIDNLRRTLVPDIVPRVKIVKAFAIRDLSDLAQADAFDGAVEMFLFQSAGVAWQTIAESYSGKTPFLLGGELERAAEACREITCPLFAGINIRDEFDNEDKSKDVRRLELFLKSVRADLPAL